MDCDCVLGLNSGFFLSVINQYYPPQLLKVDWSLKNKNFFITLYEVYISTNQANVACTHVDEYMFQNHKHSASICFI